MKYIIIIVTWMFLVMSCQNNMDRKFIKLQSKNKQQTKLQILSNQQFLKLSDKHAKHILQRSPELATGYGVTQEQGGVGYQAKLSSYTQATNLELSALNIKLFNEIKAIDKNKLTGTARITYSVMENAYKISAQHNSYNIGVPSILGINSPYVVNQLFGVHITSPQLFINLQPLASINDVKTYIKRLSHFKRTFDETIELFIEDAKNDVLAPKFVLKTVVDSARQFVDPPVENNPIYTSFVRKVKKIENISNAQVAKYSQQVKSLLDKEVYPAYHHYANSIETHIPQATNDAGVWHLKNGDAIYQTALDAYGATGLNAQQIHDLGINEVQRIHQQMDSILKDNAYTKGSISQRMKQIGSDPKFLFSNDDNGRDQIMKKIRRDVDDVMRIAPEWFGSIPPQKIEVKRIPVYEQNSSASAYYIGPPLDGSRPGEYWINLKNTHDWPAYTLKTLTYHEAVPGHHFQISLQQDVKDMPLFRNLMYFSEYGEGWALYVEELAVEMGLYKDDAIGHLGRLRSEIYRAARLVVDTGLHYKRWSREKAIDYMVFATGENQESITREIDRYIAWPGQATSYKLGMIKIKQIRKNAEELLGDKFDIRRFHDAVLLPGSMPLPALETHINAWVKQELKK